MNTVKNKTIKGYGRIGSGKIGSGRIGRIVLSLSVFSLLFMMVVVTPNILMGKEINIYSFRQKFLIDPILEKFHKAEKIKVNVVYAKKGLVERIKLEGKKSPADIILTTDVGQLVDLENAKVLKKVSSRTINNTVPKHLRSSKNLWFGLTTRARIIFASKDRVKEGSVKNYEDLLLNQWKGKICIRSGYHPYNISLISSIIENSGLDAARGWLTGLKNNLARRPQSNDRGQVKAIKEGICDVSIGNTYYYGAMYFNEDVPEQKEWAQAVKLIFPNQDNRGTHINISGMAMAKYAPNSKDALKLMIYLVGEEAQYLYAARNYEFPVNKKVPYSDFLKKHMGNNKWDEADIEKIGKLRRQAAILLDEIGFDK